MKLGQSVHTLTRSASLTDFEQVARSVGLDPFRMLRMARLPATVLDDPNMMISADSVGWLLEESARLSGQEAFGLLLAETRSLANLGMLALVLREEPTLRTAMQSGIRYLRLHNAGVQLRLEDAGDVVLLHVGANMQGGHGVWRQTVEMSTGIVLRVFRALSGNAFRPVRVTFTHERPASLEVHHRVLGTAIEFSQECNALVCRTRDLDLPIPAADPTLNREVKRWLDLQLVNLRDEPAQRARQIVRMLLPSGLCSVDQVARHLGMHRRTLNRHLAAEGESVTTVINAIRAELAEEYLASSKRRLYEFAELLGFSSGADFSRWFRGQFGKTPSEWAAHYRQSTAAADPVSHK
ncbi:HTH-type transcriptional regulator VirS [Paraburkholderia domus]|uniref:HTH-type transcriptional regulator VirS n=1 Tax=Paraburkholderia domus TaxID=2793075 RepID=A0A9N8QUN8_9BURK|nr:HTH-type transcriptional regulator VirS [Paraburkholderia domus]CAE6773625.1 HTH-type transcriptional regulator VirS [Paraburkholderia domus]CAE6824548.1 HTH-type transcriptional regulator VirS [Paraburkholderia domus]CAE6857823.1 HTH-type transcriptional regulator VirS [Paraburkholderia domus]CAE6868769.1 HTH-type transcriptional regulator VirS [Paraburkholderia domus]